MSRLEDIPKKDFFRIPDGYFDKLPAKIQMRIETPRPQHTGQRAWRYALACALPLVVGVIIMFFSTRAQTDAEAILASVETSELILYLQESEITTEEMMESFEFSMDELEALENEAYDLSVPASDAETIRSQFNQVLP